MKWIKSHPIHRTAGRVAQLFFEDLGGERGYYNGNMTMLREIAAGFDYYSAKLELPEYALPMSIDDYVEILVARGLLKRKGT